MTSIGFEIAPRVAAGDGQPLLILGGPWVIESEEV